MMENTKYSGGFTYMTSILHSKSILMHVQLTLEPHRFELCSSTALQRSTENNLWIKWTCTVQPELLKGHLYSSALFHSLPLSKTHQPQNNKTNILITLMITKKLNISLVFSPILCSFFPNNYITSTLSRLIAIT